MNETILHPEETGENSDPVIDIPRSHVTDTFSSLGGFYRALSACEAKAQYISCTHTLNELLEANIASDCSSKLHANVINMAKDMASYDRESAARYIELITSKKYIERPTDKTSKRTPKDYSLEERKEIYHRLLNRSPFNRACPVCGDEQTENGYCSSQCGYVAREVKKQFCSINDAEIKLIGN